MLSIFVIYFIARSFYELAKIHSKNKWLYAILGIAMFYVGSVTFGVILALLTYLNDNINNLINNESLLSLISIPFGLLSCWIFYKLLKRQWSNAFTNKNAFIENQIIDDQVIND
jgi:hypothetical protein